MDVEALSAKPRLRRLLDHFARIKDTRQSLKVAYLLREVLFLQHDRQRGRGAGADYLRRVLSAKRFPLRKAQWERLSTVTRRDTRQNGMPCGRRVTPPYAG